MAPVSGVFTAAARHVPVGRLMSLLCNVTAPFRASTRPAVTFAPVVQRDAGERHQIPLESRRRTERRRRAHLPEDLTCLRTVGETHDGIARRRQRAADLEDEHAATTERERTGQLRRRAEPVDPRDEVLAAEILAGEILRRRRVGCVVVRGDEVVLGLQRHAVGEVRCTGDDTGRKPRERCAGMQTKRTGDDGRVRCW